MSTLVNMTPSLPPNDISDGLTRNAELHRQRDGLSSFSAQPTDCLHFFIREFGSANPLASRRAALLDRIPDIVLRGPQEKMLRIDANRIIAPVQHGQSIGDWPIRERPGKAVGKPVLPQVSLKTICVFIYPPRPYPTVLRLPNLGPKAYPKGTKPVMHGISAIRGIAKPHAGGFYGPLGTAFAPAHPEIATLAADVRKVENGPLSKDLPCEILNCHCVLPEGHFGYGPCGADTSRGLLSIIGQN